MNPRNLTYSLALLLGVVSFLSCNSSQSQITVEKAQSTDSSLARFDPLELPADRDVIPVRSPRKGITIGSRFDNDNSITPVIQSDDSSYTYVGIPEAVDSLNNQVYRVQIATSKQFGEARKEVRIAEEIFDRPVVVDYEVPYYKVRVGSFASRDEAEEYRKRVRGTGYKNAWVVSVIVNLKRVSPLYDEYDEYYEEGQPWVEPVSDSVSNDDE